MLKEGGWNTMKITAKGKTYTVELNGKKVLEHEAGTAGEKGPIGLQVHPGLKMKIEFRDVKVGDLKSWDSGGGPTSVGLTGAGFRQTFGGNPSSRRNRHPIVHGE